MAIVKGTFGRRLVDNLIGTTGTDAFYVDNVKDNIINGGVGDQIYSTVDWTLQENGPNNLVLMASAAVYATGNSMSNTIGGNQKNNIINGAGGMDQLSGGLGADTFVFDRTGDLNADLITDFNVNEGDRIALSGSAFGVAAGTVVSFSEQVAVGSGPQVIRQSNGALYFDSDGVGAAKQVLFAAVNPFAAMNSTSFSVI